MKAYISVILLSAALLISAACLGAVQCSAPPLGHEAGAKAQLPAQLGDIKIDRRLIEGLARAKEAVPIPHPSSEIDTIESSVREMILVCQICEEEGLSISAEKQKSIDSYHERTLKEIESAGNSEDEVERETAREVLSMYLEVIQKSGLTQAEYEAFVRESMLHYLRKQMLLESVFQGDEALLNARINEYENRYTILFS